MFWSKFESQFPVIAAALKTARANRRLAHAYLLNADSQTVRTEAPQAVAQLKCCLNPAPDFTPCGVCRHCISIEHGSYPELFTLAPVSKSRQIRIGDDKQDPDSMRWFESQFYYTASSENAVKIGVIQDAECLNEQAQNAFLKTLEEPPRQTLFILVSGSPSKLLSTIRSRCQSLLLLTNRCQYPESFLLALPPLLGALQTTARQNLPAAERVAAALIDLSKNLKNEAENSVTPRWTALFDQMKQNEWSASEKKLVESRLDAAIQSEYLGLRQAFLGAVHDWFALSWQRTAGVPSSDLANPEFAGFISSSVTDEALAARQLNCAEMLLDNLRFNVNEELALRSFCLNAAFA